MFSYDGEGYDPNASRSGRLRSAAIGAAMRDLEEVDQAIKQFGLPMSPAMAKKAWQAARFGLELIENPSRPIEAYPLPEHVI